MKIAHFYLILLVIFGLTEKLITKDYSKTTSQTILQQQRQLVAQQIQELFEKSKKDLDTLFIRAITDIEKSPAITKGYQKLFEYLSNTLPDTFTQLADKIITTFSTNVKNLPLVNELRQSNIFLTTQITELADTLKKYKETLKDKLYIFIDKYIEDLDLAKKAINENLGTLTISFEDELKDISEESGNIIQDVKEFLKTSVNEFIHQATKGVVEKKTEEALERIIGKPKEEKLSNEKDI